MELCRYLRWKSAARDADDPRWIQESLLRNQVPFSCLQTCQAWGPDDDLVAPDLCRRERPCFSPDPSTSNDPRVA
jgi:hypothetical protein